MRDHRSYVCILDSHYLQRNKNHRKKPYTFQKMVKVEHKGFGEICTGDFESVAGVINDIRLKSLS